MKNQNNYKAYMLVFLCVTFWAGNFILGRYLKDDFSPIELNTIRWFIVFIIISPFFIYKTKKILTSITNNFLLMLLYGFLSVTLFNFLLYQGLQATTSNNALIINLSVPVMILFLSFFILKTPIFLHQIVGIILSIIGVLIIISKLEIQTFQTLIFNEGDIWIIVSSFTWALYSVILKYKPKELSNFEFFIAIVFIGTLLSILFYFYSGHTLQKGIELFDIHSIELLYVSFFASILSFYFWQYGVEKIGANKTAQFTYIMPLIGAFLAYLFLDESLEIYHLVGMILVSIGIYLSLFLKR